MSGRAKFHKNKRLISIVTGLFCLFPSLMRRALYRFSFALCGSLGVLLRYSINKNELMAVGDACYFAAYTILKNGKGITIGNSCSVHEFCYFDGAGEIAIGDNVSFAHGCSLISFDHSWADPDLPIKYNPTVTKKIIIESDVWFGAGVKVLAGAYVESRVVIAAGSVVKGRLESGWIYGGVPARKLKSL